MDAPDSFDTKILALLQADGRLTNNDISHQIGLSASQCSRRRTALEKSGLIRGYHAHLNKQAAGVGVISYVSINLSTHSTSNAREFMALMGSLPCVLEAHSLTGNRDYLLKVVSADLESLSHFINNVLLAHQSIQTVKTSVVLNTIKETTELPIKAPVTNSLF